LSQRLSLGLSLGLSFRKGREIQNQYKRAFTSIPLNIAEGASKQSGKDQIAEIVAVLNSLAKSVTVDPINEEIDSYSTLSYT
jgi:four helix bundle protein